MTLLGLDLDLVRTVLEIVGITIGGAMGVLWTVRTGFFTLQKRVVETLKEAVEALETRVGQLEAEVQKAQIQRQELEGVIEGKEKVITDIILSVTESGLCENAWSCDNRIVPVDHIKSRHTRARQARTKEKVTADVNAIIRDAPPE
jgi:hypothetical protein